MSASAESGYIFSMPERDHPLDTAFLRVLSCMLNQGCAETWLYILTRPGYLPDEILTTVKPGLARFAEEASSEQILNWATNAEKQQPYVKTHNAWGARYDVDKVVTSDGWKNLRRWGARNGYVPFSWYLGNVSS